MRPLLLLVTLSACGSPLLSPGIYDVYITYTRDDWPMSKAGTITQAEWHIEEDDRDYTLVVNGTPFLYEGEEEGRRVVFAKRGGECGTNVDLVLLPKPELKFGGHGEISSRFCSAGVILTTKATFFGVRHAD
jgi:hypothetical protein